MSQEIPIPQAFAKTAHINAQTYQTLYQRSLDDPEGFWREHGQIVPWIKPYRHVMDVRYSTQEVSIKWFQDGTLNASVACLDRHLKERPHKTALIWEGDDPKQSDHITYAQLHKKVCRFANVLKAQGVQKGDRVTIYMPMIPEAVSAMLACARIGAVHSVVFGGFSPAALAQRITDCRSQWVITADEGRRGAKTIPLKANVDAALEHTAEVTRVLVVRHTGQNIPMTQGRDLWLHEELEKVSETCLPEEMNAEDPLFILYTSGSTGAPKGVLHTTGGYMVYATLTHRWVFDLHEDDIYWCTADVGWITGHSYIVYGPLSNGATSVIFEGVPTYPDAGRFWQVVDKHKVSLFYTAPTAIRALMREGDEPVRAASRASLRLLGTVGEPINPEAWRWYHQVVGDGRCPVVDTWWQTETGGILITPLPGATPLKPGSACKPFFGVRPVIVDDDGNELTGPAQGHLCLAPAWPGQSRTVFGDHQRFIETYFTRFKGLYTTGDGCRRDAQGDYWITGRVDDVMNVSGHRLGTAEIESALVGHASVAEAAVVGIPHEVKGEVPYAYVILKSGVVPAPTLSEALKEEVATKISPIARPETIHMAPALPKTRSGKIMRRILRKIATGHTDDLGDTSTLAEPDVVQTLLASRTK